MTPQVEPPFMDHPQQTLRRLPGGGFRLGAPGRRPIELLPDPDGWRAEIAGSATGWRLLEEASTAASFVLRGDPQEKEIGQTFCLPGTETRIPVWLLVVAVGLPTAKLWWRDHGQTPGYCKVFRYDVTGTCPECGTENAGVRHAE